MNVIAQASEGLFQHIWKKEDVIKSQHIKAQSQLSWITVFTVFQYWK